MLRVLLVEDNDVFREALQLVLGLQDSLEVAGAVRDGEGALAACRASCPDVALVDFRLPDLDGVEVTRAIRASCPGVVVLALTAAANAPEVEALLAAGAVACLPKTLASGEIVAAIRAAASGVEGSG